MASPKNILEKFRKDKKLLAANGVTEEELKFLSKVDMFGSLKSTGDILFILKNIRDAEN
jgi:hypothetical protein